MSLAHFSRVVFASALVLLAAAPQPASARANAPVVIGVVGVAAAAAAVFATSTDGVDGLPTNTVPLASFGVGAFDVIDSDQNDRAIDFRAEYRFGKPFWYVLKPLIALQMTSDGGGGAFAGVVADWLVDGRWVIAPSFAAGLWGHGDGKDLGSAIEFRSQLEVGYRFENDWRLTGAFSHISNADIGSRNPGVEIANVYLHIPADTLLPR